MADQEQDRLLDHDYDGIREYDNPMPRWWLWIFYASIAFVPVYYLLPGNMGAGPGMVAEYEAEVAAYEASRPAAGDGGVSGETLLALVSDPTALANGKSLYDMNCAVCHRADGGGLIGPNLTDDAWLHGSAPTAIHATIANGVLEKGMPPWDRLLKPEQVNAVTAYVISLRGTNPPAPKAPEGVVEPAAPPVP